MKRLIYRKPEGGEVWVGDSDGYVTLPDPENWGIIQAAKFPWYDRYFRYVEPPKKGHPEYHYLYRGHKLALNLDTAKSMDQINRVAVVEALAFIDQLLNLQKRVLVHSNLGNIRAPCIAAMYLLKTRAWVPQSQHSWHEDFMVAYEQFTPTPSWLQFIEANWLYISHPDM